VLTAYCLRDLEYLTLILDIMASQEPLSGEYSPMASHAARAHAFAGRQNPAVPRPLPQSVVDRGHRYGIAQRVQCLTLQVEGFSWKDIEAKTGVKQPAQSAIKKRAFQRGFRPEQDPRILEYYVEDGARSGRPKEITSEIEQRLLDSNSADRSDREKSSEVLAYECGISRSSALQILHKHSLLSVKPTRKPGLNLY
jgi:hypothetical protein